MKSALAILLTFSVSVVLGDPTPRDKPTKPATRLVDAKDTRLTRYLELPPVPRGCIVRVYPVGRGATFPRALRERTDWADYLRSLGMLFPNGGFATYVAEGSVLIVANTPEQMSLLDPI